MVAFQRCSSSVLDFVSGRDLAPSDLLKSLIHYLASAYCVYIVMIRTDLDIFFSLLNVKTNQEVIQE